MREEFRYMILYELVFFYKVIKNKEIKK